MAETLTLQIPDTIYRRLVDMASATGRPLEEIVLRVLEVGSSPTWTDVPEPFQSDLAALDRLDNDALWHIAYGQMPTEVSEQFEAVLESPDHPSITSYDQAHLDELQTEGDRFMLRKAQSATILRWRGCHVPLP